VCALVGANGSGKSTLLDVPALLGDAVDHGLARALEEHGGVAAARNKYAQPGEPFDFQILIDGLMWHLAPMLTENGFRSSEEIAINGRVVVSREAGADNAKIFGSDEPVRDILALTAASKHAVPELAPLLELLSRYRMYASYDLTTLRRSGSPESSKRRLDRQGTNVFSLLRNWRDRRPDRERYEFVIDGLRDIFADFFEDLSLENAVQVIGAEIHLKGDRSHSVSLAPDGWFTALLHLAAVASTDAGDLIAIDEPENALHPHAIKLLLEHIRVWSQRRLVTILLATHSPVIISDFDTRPEQLYVMQQDHRGLSPVPVTGLKERAWLAHFTLGDLYMREEFGAPRDDAEHRPHHDR
jgi:predicted ATPase